MAAWLVPLALAGATGVLALRALRLADRRKDRAACTQLEQTSGPAPERFAPEMVSDLPEPARRYFLFAIESGTPLSKVARIEMTGQISLGTREKPDYLAMRASQVLAGPDGFVWSLRARGRKMWLSGTDGYAAGEGWTRFWLYDLLPVVRAGGGDDYARSAAGRSIAESLFWVPAALLPSDSVQWEPVDSDTARALVTHRGHRHALELTVGPDGRPRSVSLLRWSRENSERQWRLQPFGGTIGEILRVGGFRVAATVEGGNGFGTEAYFPFYSARVLDVRFV